MKACVIIPAGGSGKRMGGNCPKQFLLLGGVPVLVHTIVKFDRAAGIDQIILVLPEAEIPAFRESISDLSLSKPVRMVPGGRERQDSVRNGLDAVEDDIDMIAIHDGVRPFIREEAIARAMAAAARHGAASVGVPAKDTIKKAAPGGLVDTTLDRTSLWITQTPQVFRKEVIREAYRRAYEEGYYGTDDAALVERIGLAVVMVPGSYENVKLTTPEDLAYGEFILSRSGDRKGGKSGPDMKTGIGYDSHRLKEGRKLILGGVEIPHGQGLDGHSDADALVHAVIDALLGAMGEGDIGKHFPDSDPGYKGVSSLDLLGRVAVILERKKYAVGNIDATVLLEQPRLGPYIQSMRENISGVLGIRPEAVSIKAKTDEGMGFVGRREGAAVFAVASLVAR